MKSNNSQNPQIKGFSQSNSTKNIFLILITVLLTINLILIVFSASINKTVLNPEFVGHEFEKYDVYSDENSKDYEKLFKQVRSAIDFFYFVFYLLIILSLILTLFVVLIAYREIINMLIYLAASAISASLLSYAIGILAVKVISDRIQTQDSSLSEKIIIDSLLGGFAAVKDYAVFLLVLGLMLLVLAYIAQRMVKFLTRESQ